MKKILIVSMLISSACHLEGSFAQYHAQESLKILGLCTAATTLYGTLNGIGVGGLFPEFTQKFPVYKGCHAKIGGSGKRAGAAWGALESWYVGPFLSLIVIPAARCGKNPLKATELIRPGLITLALSGSIAWLRGGITHLRLIGGDTSIRRSDIGETINGTGYAMGAIGAAACSAYVWLSRYQ